MPRNITQKVIKLLTQRGTLPVSEIYRAVNAGRRDEKDRNASEVLEHLVSTGVLTLTIVKTGKNGRPFKYVAINTQHISYTNPVTTPVEGEEADKPARI